LALLILLHSQHGLTAPRRISSGFLDLGEVHKIYLAQGLASIIQLPYPVTGWKRSYLQWIWRFRRCGI